MHLIKTAVLTEKPNELRTTFFSPNYLTFVNNYSVEASVDAFARNDAFILDTLRPEVLFLCLRLLPSRLFRYGSS